MKRDAGGKKSLAAGEKPASQEKHEPGRSKGGWQAIAGKAGEDRLFRKAMNLGAKWRKQANA
jgi:hypothetical protein